MSDNEKVDLTKKLQERGIDPRMASIVKAPDVAPTWDVPVHHVDLPSRGLVYPVESNLHGKETIEIRSMTAKEEDILTSRSLLRQGKAMSMLLQNCMIDKSIDPDEMLVGDRNSLLVAIRMSGYGQGYDCEVDCPVCSESFEHDFDIEAASTVKELGAEPAEAGLNLFAFTLPMSKVDVTFKLLTGAEDKDLNTAAERMKKANGVGAPTSNITLRLFHHVQSIGADHDRVSIKRKIDTMLAGDAKALRTHIDKVQPGLDIKSHITCPSCGEESEVEVPIGPDFFWPDM